MKSPSNVGSIKPFNHPLVGNRRTRRMGSNFEEQRKKETDIFPFVGLLRCGKSCRLRWTNYLRPDIKRGPFTSEEEKLVIQLHAILGNRYMYLLPGKVIRIKKEPDITMILH